MFIKINNRILDYNKHRRASLLVKNHIIITIYDVLRTYGFEKTKKGFINKDLNLNLELKFSKLKKEVFV